MPPITWPTDPLKLVQGFELRRHNPTAGALFAWAAFTVETLHYLDDIDSAYEESRQPIGGHRPEIVDIAHARWATGASVTAMDLCAAGLGRAFCNNQTTHELDLGDFEPNGTKARQRKLTRRAQLPAPALKWVDSVYDDPRYATVKEARDWLTHSRVRQHITATTGGPPARLGLGPTSGIGVRYLVEEARNLATHHVFAFFRILPQL